MVESLQVLRRSVSISFKGDSPRVKSRTHQSFAKEADVNNIMKRYKRTGLLVDPTVVARRTPYFGDFSSGSDFQTVAEQISNARSSFMFLPAEVRERFGNDVSKLLDFVAEPSNYSEAVKLGLIPKDAVKDKAIADAAEAANKAALEAAKAAAGAGQGAQG